MLKESVALRDPPPLIKPLKFQHANAAENDNNDLPLLGYCID